ncbi:MAG: type I restriction enzyme HsdR N-terminal domain-containing protein [Desulfobulbia bacterium]
MFESLNFNTLNETDVREEVLAPLIRCLGYRSGTENNVIREQSLRYPRAFLGRKQPSKDPILRGKADYILEVKNKIRWVIEAKAPEVEIDIDTIEQAYTYANHPEVRAVYFVLSNGINLKVFQTNRGPNQEPIFQTEYNQLNNVLSQLVNLLGPEAIVRDHPEVTLDTGPPLALGLRSVVRIANGLITYNYNSLNNRALNEMQTSIAEGAVERDENGKMIAYLKTLGPSRSLQDLNERLGLASFEMVSDDEQLSTDKNMPTIFKYDQTILLPAGETLIDLNTWSEHQLPFNLSCHVLAKAEGVFNAGRFYGQFTTSMNYIEACMVVEMQGGFEIYLV